MQKEVEFRQESDINKWYSKSIEETLKGLDTDKEGLSAEESKKRILKHGVNELPQKRRESVIVEFLKQLNSPLIYVLWAAIAISLAIKHYIDVLVILAMILINATIGFVQERKAENAILSLKRMIISYAKVFRDGELVKVPSKNLVPGDIIFLEEGDRVPADSRLFEIKDFRTQEASLTGESLPKEKELKIFDKKIALADRDNMVYMGTTVVSGTAKAIVVYTGKHTEIGQVAKAIEEVVQPKSHYSKKIKQLTILVSSFAIAGALTELLLGLFYNHLPFSETFLFAIASLVSGIPEGLPAALAIVLSIGARRMAKRQAVIRYLPAIDTLGVTTVIATDKTGTITENSMVVENVITSKNDFTITGDGWIPVGRFLKKGIPVNPSKDSDLDKLLHISAMCNSGNLIRQNGKYQIVGDPTEVALIVLAKKANLDKENLEHNEKILDDLAFSSELKFRATLIELASKGKRQIYSTGAFESVIKKSSYILDLGREIKLDKKISDSLIRRAEKMAKRGMRVLALAYKDVPHHIKGVSSDDVKDLILAGIVGMQDPPRKNVKEAITKAKRAGIRVIMKTGDYKETALAIANEIGLAGKNEKVLTEEELEAMNYMEFREAVKKVNIFARVTPKMKLKIVKVLQEMGEIVAMTGDGINDAPALKRADIGIAMGRDGTDVARESSEMVLIDDNFVSIVDAVEQGRVVFQNIRKTSFYLVSTGIAEDATVVTSMTLNFPLIMLPIHFLYLNLVTAGFTSVSLAMEPEDEDVLSFKPRNKKEGILTKELIPYLVLVSGLMVGATILMFHYFLPQGLAKARTIAFATMSMLELFQLYNMRSLNQSLLKIKAFSNKWVNLGFICSVALMGIAFYVPFFQNVLNFTPLPLNDVLLILAVSFPIIIVAEIYKLIKRKIFKKKNEEK